MNSQTFDFAKLNSINMTASASYPRVTGGATEQQCVVRIHGPSMNVPPNSVVFLNGKLFPGLVSLVLIHHKTKNALSIMKDNLNYEDQQRKYLGRLLLDLHYICYGMHLMGRLDYDST